MIASQPRQWELVAQGLTLKLLAMWLIFPSLIFPFIHASHFGLMLAALFPLSIDLVGRCFCMSAPVLNKNPIRLSIMAQCSGILALTLLTLVAGLAGAVLGIVIAAVFQASAAKWFIAHLKLIAERLDRPEMVVNLGHLQRRLLATTLSMYGGGAITIIVLPCALLLGLMAYGIGLILTLPIAFLILTPILVSSMVVYFFMLYSYERTLRELRNASHAHSQSSV
jgi:hypothetical protein